MRDKMDGSEYARWIEERQNAERARVKAFWAKPVAPARPREDENDYRGALGDLFG